MSEKDFQAIVLEQLSHIQHVQLETLQRVAKLEAVGKHYEEGFAQIAKQGERITVVEQSTKSAHHRINSVYAIASALGAIVSFLINLGKDIFIPGGGGR